jgi:hypothetical protein
MNGERIPAKRHRLEHVELFEVLGGELDQIEQEAATLGTDLQFALVLLPIALSFTVTLVLTTIPTERKFNAFLIVTILAYIAGLYCAKRWWQHRGGLKKLFQEIRERRVGPVGEEGKELNPAELAELPASEPPPEPSQKVPE